MSILYCLATAKQENATAALLTDRSEGAEVIGVVQTRRKCFDRTTGKLTISKRPQAAYCHIKCVGKKEDYDKDYHICNYMEAYIT